MSERSAGCTRVRYDPTEGTVTVADDGDDLLVGTANVTEADSATTGMNDPRVSSGADDEVTEKRGDLEIADIVLGTASGGVTATLTIENVGNEPIRVGDVVLSFETVFGSDARIYRHGYQSWSPTGTLPVGEQFPEEDADNAPMMDDLAAPADVRVSSYLTGLIEGDQTVTAGFLDHDRYCTRFEIDDGVEGITTVRAVCPLEGTRLEPNESLTLPTLWIDAGRDLRPGLAALAALVGDRMDARVPEEAPTGWCSWYHYFTDISEPDVRENLSELREWGIPVDVVQIDDGYMESFGDWRSIADGFDDMSEIASDIESAGYRPGLWLAPFYVEEGADLYAEHPEWFVTKPNEDAGETVRDPEPPADSESPTSPETSVGDPVDGGFRAGSQLYGLDTTHPEVLKWLEATFSPVVDKWGFSYLKLDFLFAAALPGERYDSEATRLEAYRRGVETIVETVGDDVFLLGCGAPMAPSVGLFDAMRIGPDTDPVWETPGAAASQPGLRNAVRNTLTRDYLHRRWWLNDPDCQLVRDTSDLTDAEREAFAALVATTGGVNVFSDRLAEIGETGRRLLGRTIPSATGGVVEGLNNETFPERVVCERPGDDARTVALFNWDDEPSTVQFDVRGDGGDESTRDGVDDTDSVIWDGLRGEIVDGPVLKRELPAHGAAVFSVVPAGAGDVVGDAATLTGGSDRVSKTASGAYTLTATVDDEDVTFWTG